MKTEPKAGEKGAAGDAPWRPVKVVAVPSSRDVHGEPMIEVTLKTTPTRRRINVGKKSNLNLPAVAARERGGGAGGKWRRPTSSIPLSQSSRKKVAINLADECDFRKVEPAQAEACCLYEYFRESAAMREAFKQERPMPLKGYRDEDVHDYVRLRIALTKARFPVPWNRLAPNQRKRLAIPLYSPNGKQYFGTGVLAWHLKDRAKYPALLVKEFSPRHDPVETDCLLKQWKQEAYYDAPVSRSYFFGVFRLDETYNEMEAKEAFTEWFRKRNPKTKGGNRDRWHAKLNDLVVMRLRKQFPNKHIKRVEHVAKLTTSGFKACKDFWKERSVAKREQRYVEARISNAARTEMSGARAAARDFFQRLFLGEEPLSF